MKYFILALSLSLCPSWVTFAVEKDPAVEFSKAVSAKMRSELADKAEEKFRPILQNSLEKRKEFMAVPVGDWNKSGEKSRSTDYTKQ